MGATTYHEGELAVQRRVGVSETAKFRSAHQKTFLGSPAQDYLKSRPYVVISAQDDQGRIFCTMVATRDGSPCLVDMCASHFVLKAAMLKAGDALRGALVPGTAVGVIGIDFETRARVRVNCTVEELLNTGDVRLAVDICASHCPQYIPSALTKSVDEPEPVDEGEARAQQIAVAAAPVKMRTLEDEEVRSLINHADTFFIGSTYGKAPGDKDGRHGADCSNRCGSPGFVRVTGPDTLSFDNYNGNQMYSTLGNITTDPRVGLTFFDWETGDMLQVSGTAAIDFAPEQKDKDHTSQGGVERVLQVVVVKVDSVVRVAKGLPGHWTRARSRPLMLSKKVEESEGVVSFYLEAPTSTAPLAPFKAGQHMPVLLNGLNRSYSLSGDPKSSFYRITVKNIGQVSSALHGLKEGDLVECLPPAGSFGPASLPESSPVDAVVLVAAGVGITPMVSMAYSAKTNKLPTAVVHAVRNAKQWPFRSEFQHISQRSAEEVPVKLRAFLSRPEEHDLDDEEGGWKIAAKRVSVEDLLKIAFEDLGATNPLFCFCGPLPFSAPLQAALEEAGVSAANIKSESFG